MTSDVVVNPRRLRRYIWLLAVFVPASMLVFYAHLSPHYESLPDLPALPKVQLQINPKEPVPETAYLPDCICGTTSRGRHLCDIYGEHALRASRLVEGSGARMRNLLARLNQGMDLTIGVLGGSGMLKEQLRGILQADPQSLPVAACIPHPNIPRAIRPDRVATTPS